MSPKTILAFAAGPVLSAALGFMLLPLLAWYFPPEDIGRNGVFQIFTSFAVLVCVLGLDQAYVREFHETNNRYALFKACFVPGFVLLVIALCATLPLSGKLSQLLYGEVEPLWYVLTGACVLFSFTSRFLSLIVRMQERGIAYSASQVLPKLVVLSVLAGYVVFGADRTYTNLLLANLASVSVVAGIFFWNTRADWSQQTMVDINWTELKKVLRFGAPLIGAGVAYWGFNATSTIALRTFSNFRELGIYSMAMSFAGAAVIFQAIFSTIWMPTVYKWVASKADLSRLNVAVNYVLAGVCMLFCIAGLLSWLIDLILPTDYVAVKYIVVCCMAQPLLYTLSEATVVGLNIQRKSMHALGIAILSLMSNALLSVLLVPHFGASGAAIANSLAYFCFLIARTEVSARVWSVGPRGKLYCSISVMLALAISAALIGDRLPFHISFVWILPTVLMPFFFRNEMAALSAFLGTRFQSIRVK